jgi:uncharacterized integral membrane protein (TIGR00698 family)
MMNISTLFINFINMKRNYAILAGIALTFIISLGCHWLSKLPILMIMGPMVMAIIIGMIWRSSLGVSSEMLEGSRFASKHLLRYGIILLGTRLNLQEVLATGVSLVGFAVGNVIFALLVVYGIAKLFHVEQRIALLSAVGTAICGAAAIAAISPILKAKDDEVAASVLTVAVLGTVFTVLYTLLFPWLALAPGQYGWLAGASLHEIGHVIAAAEPKGQAALDLALLMKLTRVALLVPVALGLAAAMRLRSGIRTADRTQASDAAGNTQTPMPWFIGGFLAMSALSTLGVLSSAVGQALIAAAYFLLAMGMAGLGLGVDLSTIKRSGLRTLAAALLGSVLLCGLAYAEVRWLV